MPIDDWCRMGGRAHAHNWWVMVVVFAVLGLTSHSTLANIGQLVAPRIPTTGGKTSNSAGCDTCTCTSRF